MRTRSTQARGKSASPETDDNRQRPFERFTKSVIWSFVVKRKRLKNKNKLEAKTFSSTKLVTWVTSWPEAIWRENQTQPICGDDESGKIMIIEAEMCKNTFSEERERERVTRGTYLSHRFPPRWFFPWRSAGGTSRRPAPERACRRSRAWPNPSACWSSDGGRFALAPDLWDPCTCFARSPRRRYRWDRWEAHREEVAFQRSGCQTVTKTNNNKKKLQHLAVTTKKKKSKSTYKEERKFEAERGNYAQESGIRKEREKKDNFTTAFAPWSEEPGDQPAPGPLVWTRSSKTCADRPPGKI